MTRYRRIALETSPLPNAAAPDVAKGRSLLVENEPFTEGQYATIHDGILQSAGDGGGVFTCNLAVKIMGEDYCLEHARKEIALHYLASRITDERGTLVPGRAPAMHASFMWCPGRCGFAMERMDGNLYKLLNNTKNTIRKAKIATRALAQVSAFLIAMQRKYRFMHRDLHGSNVLYKLDDGFICPFTTPVSRMNFFVADFGNARVEKFQCPSQGRYLWYIQRHVYFSAYNQGLDLNTLVLSIRPFFSESMRELPIMRKTVQYFLKEAPRHCSYTHDAKLTLKRSMQELGTNIASHPYLGDVPLFWFSYEAACRIQLPLTRPDSVWRATSKKQTKKKKKRSTKKKMKKNSIP